MTVELSAKREEDLLKQVNMIYWKKWDVKHECETLKEGV